jgi:hypothetical protein
MEVEMTLKKAEWVVFKNSRNTTHFFLSLVLFVFLMVPSESNAQSAQFSDLEKFVDNNYSMKLRDSLFLDSLNKKNIFFIGETHSYKGNGNIQFLILQLLLKRDKKIHLLIEAPYSLKKCYSDYIYGGDTTVFFKLSSALDNSYYDTFFYRNLRNLIATSGGNIEIDIHMIDIEQNFNLTFYRLVQLFDRNTPPPKSIEGIVGKIKQINIPDKIKTIPKDLYKKYTTYASDLQKLLKNHSKDFSEFLGDDYAEFITIEENLIIGIKTKPYKYNVSYKRQELREVAMYNNSLKYIKMNEVYMGHVGAYHAPLKPVFLPISLRIKKSLAFQLNENADSPVRNKVSSFLLIYPNQELKQANFEIITDEDVRKMAELESNKSTIIYLNQKKSEFDYLLPYFDYLIINRY